MWYHFNNLTISWNLPNSCNFLNSIKVLAHNLVIHRPHRNHSIGFCTKDVRAVDTYRRSINLIPAHSFRLAQRTINRLGGTVKMSNHTLAHATIRSLAHADNSWRAACCVDMTYNTSNHGSPNVNTDSISRCFLHAVNYNAYGVFCIGMAT